MLVLLARDPGVGDLTWRERGECLFRQQLHVHVLDLPTTGHLLDDQLGVHPHSDLGRRVDLVSGRESRDEPAVLRHIVRGDANGLAPLGEHLAGDGILDDRAVRRPPRVAARAAVGLDEELARHSPESAVRTRIRPHSSQRTTSFDAASRRRLISVLLSSSRQPSQRLCRSAAAPSPPLDARSLVYSASRSSGTWGTSSDRCSVRSAISASIVVNAASRATSVSASRWSTSACSSRSLTSRVCTSSSRCMTSSSASSRSPWRRDSEAISCWRFSSSLGEETWPASIRFWSRSARARTCSTSASALRTSRSMSLSSVSAATILSRTWPRVAVSAAISLSSGIVARRCASWSSEESTCCTSSKRSCAKGSAFSAGPPSGRLLRSSALRSSELRLTARSRGRWVASRCGPPRYPAELDPR